MTISGRRQVCSRVQNGGAGRPCSNVKTAVRRGWQVGFGGSKKKVAQEVWIVPASLNTTKKSTQFCGKSDWNQLKRSHRGITWNIDGHRTPVIASEVFVLDTQCRSKKYSNENHAGQYLAGSRSLKKEPANLDKPNTTTRRTKKELSICQSLLH